MQAASRTCFALFVVVVVGGFSTTAKAQFENRWLAAGELHHVYRSSGAEQENWRSNNQYGLLWPAIKQQYGTQRAAALWLGARNFTSETGEEYPHKLVHVGPRGSGRGEFFPQEFRKVSRFEPPMVSVDGFDTFLRPSFVDEVNADIEPAQFINNVANTKLGVTMRRKIMQFSQPYHDNYHIIEYTFTNTGNVDDDEDRELQDQTLNDFYVYGIKRVVHQKPALPGSGWGQHVMNDVVGDGMEDYATDFRAQYAWVGNSPGADIDPLGSPIRNDNPARYQEGDTLGRLVTHQFTGTVTLHADEYAHQPGESAPDDPSQPATTGYVDNDSRVTAGTDQYDRQQMANEWDLVTKGHEYPHHADVVDQDDDFTTAEGDPQLGRAGGYAYDYAYGPYTLEPGESIRIVVADAVSGLSEQAALEIGRQFKASGWDPEAPIEYDANSDGEIGPEERMGKNDWFMTSRDSLFKTFRRALANYNANYNIPSAPKPPSQFEVVSGVDQIQLNWSVYEDANPAGFEIYRSENRFEGDIENAFQYELVHEADPDARSFKDTDVIRGIDYYYYIQSVGEVNQDGTGMTPTGVPLKSNRYWTQTYDPAQLKRAPGAAFEDARVVPNPYNLASDESVRWPGRRDQIAFLDIPGQATIRILSESGELIKTIEHTDGSGDAYWGLDTSSNQLVVSGIYFAVIENHETGEVITRKFSIVR